MKPYKSLFSDLMVDSANHIAELICKRNAEKDNSGSLPQNFWRLPQYQKLYIKEVSQARILLRIYDERAIIRALERWEVRFIKSLRTKRLIPIIEEEQSKIKETKFSEEEIKEVSKAKPFGQNKLEEL